jgi:hypothetical protein
MAQVGDIKRPSLLDVLAIDRLQWLPEIGVGYDPVRDGVRPYDQAYFDRFAAQADTDIGRALMRARVAFVAKWWGNGIMIDVGIGSGAFIELRGQATTLGFDVNPAAIAWLESRGLMANPYLPSVPAVSLWDVLEHIPDFPRLLSKVTNWAFVSLPIFRDCDHVLASKHFRRTEHVWYFTRDGLVSVMSALGWELCDESEMEVECGREDIGAYAFRRA